MPELKTAPSYVSKDAPGGLLRVIAAQDAAIRISGASEFYNSGINLFVPDQSVGSTITLIDPLSLPDTCTGFYSDMGIGNDIGIGSAELAAANVRTYAGDMHVYETAHVELHGNYSVLSVATVQGVASCGGFSAGARISNEHHRGIWNSTKTFASIPPAIVNLSDLAFEAIRERLLVVRGSESVESLIFSDLLPSVRSNGGELIRHVDALVRSREMPDLTRHYFAYMLSYLEGQLQRPAYELLQQYMASDDRWLRSGAEEGLERLASV